MTTRRALLGAAGGLLATVAAPAACAQDARLPGSFEAWRRRFDARDDGAPDAATLLAEAEAHLAAGDAPAALDTLQRAANLAHTPQIECTITRAQAQAGAYRQALAFGAHAALSHRAFPAAMALYAWLLHAGGQSVVAARLLDDAIARAPDDAVLQQARAQLAQPWPQPLGALAEAPLRCAPHASGPAPPAAVLRSAGTALLCGDGHTALAPRSVVGAAQRLWVRNGLGEGVAAAPDAAGVIAMPGVASGGLVRLRLASPLPVPPIVAAPRPVFAGSPVAAVEHAVRAPGDAAWPVLRQGFAGRAAGSGARPLGIVLPPGPRGGPVFDRAGHLAGLALPADGGAVLLPVGAFPHGHATGPEGGAPAALDAVFEAALPLTLQVLLPAG